MSGVRAHLDAKTRNLKLGVDTADGSRVNASALPFTGFDVLFTRGVGLLLMVGASVRFGQISVEIEGVISIKA